MTLFRPPIVSALPRTMFYLWNINRLRSHVKERNPPNLSSHLAVPVPFLKQEKDFE